ncbi:hypothetical protein BJ508DRAFT_313593 [Ascobolus immersus RN42]|uniref:Uncharacterized protein n=1 Tax=Ascobolus immersus RN42 TaxID=1160509 RepID=A0A3N4HVP1_ASCIM|nr:hypothetical protein BJ508DRAFT_313593 [Ascobolus immersus RN42]
MPKRTETETPPRSSSPTPSHKHKLKQFERMFEDNVKTKHPTQQSTRRPLNRFAELYITEENDTNPSPKRSAYKSPLRLRAMRLRAKHREIQSREMLYFAKLSVAMEDFAQRFYPKERAVWDEEIKKTKECAGYEVEEELNDGNISDEEEDLAEWEGQVRRQRAKLVFLETFMEQVKTEAFVKGIFKLARKWHARGNFRIVVALLLEEGFSLSEILQFKAYVEMKRLPRGIRRRRVTVFRFIR